MASRYTDRAARDYQRDSRDREMPKKDTTFWISNVGINREVIQTEICFFLGNDARVRPGTNEMTGESGYKITAYRNLTQVRKRLYRGVLEVARLTQFVRQW